MVQSNMTPAEMSQQRMAEMEMESYKEAAGYMNDFNDDEARDIEGTVEPFNNPIKLKSSPHEDTVDIYEELDDDECVVQLENVHKTYLLGIEGIPALRGVGLKVKRGEWITIFGTSGGGKTSMLNIIGTIDKPTKGEVSIAGVRVNNNTSDEKLAFIRREKLGFVFQTFNLLSAMNALENVEMPMILAGKLGRGAMRKRARELLASVGVDHRANSLPNMLSGGEQQRVTIARALANSPDILLLDEPTGDLDTKNTDIVVSLLRKLNEEMGITIVMVTHDVALKNFGNRVVMMRDGKIASVKRVPKDKRAEAHAKLESSMEAAGLKVGDDDEEKEGEKTISMAQTELRKPWHYKPLAHRKPVDNTGDETAIDMAPQEKLLSLKAESSSVGSSSSS